MSNETLYVNAAGDESNLTPIPAYDWETPTGDSHNGWANAGNIRNDLTSDYAWDSIPATSWGDQIFGHTDAGGWKCDRVRYYMHPNTDYDVNQIRVRVRKESDSSWIDVYEGAFTEDTWEEKTFTAEVIDRMEITCYNSGASSKYARLAEVDFGYIANYRRVDEETPNDDTDYVATVNATYLRDFYNLDNHVDAEDDIMYVRVYGRAKSNGTPTQASMKLCLKLSGSTDESTETTLTSGWANYYHDFTTKPGGGSWSPSDLDALQAGVSLRQAATGKGAQTSYCTQVYVVVHYLPGGVTNAPATYQFGVVTPGSSPATGLSHFTMTSEDPDTEDVDVKGETLVAGTPGRMLILTNDGTAEHGRPADQATISANRTGNGSSALSYKTPFKALYYNDHLYWPMRDQTNNKGPVYKFSCNTFTKVAEITPVHNGTDAVESDCICIGSDGYLYTLDWDGWLYKIDLSTFTQVGAYRIRVVTAKTMGDMKADLGFIYGCMNDGYVWKFNESTHAVTTNQIVTGWLQTLIVDQDYFYVTCMSGADEGVFKVRCSDLGVESQLYLSSITAWESTCCQDETYIYFAISDSSDDVAILRVKKSDLTYTVKTLTTDGNHHHSAITPFRYARYAENEICLYSMYQSSVGGTRHRFWVIGIPDMTSVDEYLLDENPGAHQVALLADISNGLFYGVHESNPPAEQQIRVKELAINWSKIGLKAGLSGGSYNVVVKKDSPYNELKADLASEATQDWGLQMICPSGFDLSAEFSGEVTLICSGIETVVTIYVTPQRSFEAEDTTPVGVEGTTALLATISVSDSGAGADQSIPIGRSDSDAGSGAESTSLLASLWAQDSSG